MKRGIVPGGILALSLAVVLLAAMASTASADEIGRTEGDARAAFEAEPGGGMAIAFTHCGPTETACPNPSGEFPNGSPTGGIPPERLGRAQEESVRIYPLANGSYCASGWHTMFLSWWEWAQFHDNYADVFAYLNAVDIQFAWDGVPLVEERTAIKRLVDFPDPGFEDVFWFNTGTFMPPGSLSVGKHRLSATSFDPLYKEENGKWSVSITILPC